MNSFQWVTSMQVINCMEIEDFEECFGEKSGRWLWAKFIGDHKQNIASFICYLDYSNAQKLYRFVLKRIEKMAPGMCAAMSEAVTGVIDPNKMAGNFGDNIKTRQE